MPSLDWSAESNRVCVPEIDDQHKEIFHLANDLHQALAGGALLSAVESELRELIAHTRSHFNREEGMMRSQRYRAYAWHKGQHDAIRTTLAELEKSLARGEHEAVLPVLDYFTAWLQTHTAVSDRMLGAYLRTTPAAAQRRK
jgi:hemerythrin